MRMIREVPAALVVLGLALAPVSPAGAESAPSEPSPGELAREGLDRMMRALHLLVESIPQYEMPEVLDNGDIIIRRKPREAPAGEPEIKETAT